MTKIINDAARLRLCISVLGFAFQQANALNNSESNLLTCGTTSCEMRPGHGYGDRNHGHTKDKWEEDHGEDYDNNDFNKINYNVWQ